MLTALSASSEVFPGAAYSPGSPEFCGVCMSYEELGISSHFCCVLQNSKAAVDLEVIEKRLKKGECCIIHTVLLLLTVEAS